MSRIHLALQRGRAERHATLETTVHPKIPKLGARVLLVGPADRQLNELKVALEQEGFLTQTAGDGIQGRETGQGFQPHLVITEIELSGISGFELSTCIWNGEAGFTAPVVFYTQSYRDEKLRQAAISDHHALHYFVKPFQQEELLRTVVPMLAKVERSAEKETQEKTQVQAPPEKVSAEKATTEKVTTEKGTAKKVATQKVSAKKGTTQKVSAKKGTARKVTTQKVNAKTVPQKIVKRSSANQSPVPAALLTERLAWAAAWSAAQCPPADKPRINMRKHLLQPSGSSPEVQLPDSGPWRGPSAVTSPESRASFLSGSIRNTESGVKESSSAEVATEAPVEWESPLRGDSSVIPIPAEQVPEEPDIGLSANRFFTRRTQLLAGTMAVFSVIGLSLVSRSVPSIESSKPEASRETSGFQAPSQEGMRSLDQDYLKASTAPASLNQPSEPSSTIQGSPTIHPERKSGNSMSSASSIPELMITDISPVERQPFLKTMVRPGLSATEIRRMGSNSFVVILELNQDGKVKKAILLTPDPERIFPDQILDTVRKWQFAPRDRHQRGAWVKYFSFQAPSGAHP